MISFLHKKMWEGQAVSPAFYFTLREKQRERGRVIMASIRVPDVIPSPAEDAEQLRSAFEGLLLTLYDSDQFDFIWFIYLFILWKLMLILIVFRSLKSMLDLYIFGFWVWLGCLECRWCVKERIVNSLNCPCCFFYCFWRTKTQIWSHTFLIWKNQEDITVLDHWSWILGG